MTAAVVTQPDRPAPPAGVARPVVLALVATIALTAPAVFVGGGWPAAWAAATIVAVVAAGATLPMLVAALRLPPALAGPRVLAVGMLRAMVTLGGAAAAWKLLGLAKGPVFGLALAYYFALLAAETWAASRAVVGRTTENG